MNRNGSRHSGGFRCRSRSCRSDGRCRAGPWRRRAPPRVRQALRRFGLARTATLSSRTRGISSWTPRWREFRTRRGWPSGLPISRAWSSMACSSGSRILPLLLARTESAWSNGPDRTAQESSMTANSLTAFVRATLAAIAILTVGIPAKAQQDPTAGALAMAREILVLKGAANLYEPMVLGVIERAKLVFLGYNPLLSKDLNDVAAKLRADMGNRAAELMAESSKLYAARFSEQELKETLAFYKSPLGRKLIAE